MLVHNWTTVPRPPARPHTETPLWIYQILSFEPVTEQHRGTLHNKSVCAALVVKDGTGRQTHSGRGRRRGGGGGLHCMKEAVDKCSWVHLYTGQFKSAQWRKTQLSSKHQRILVMMKTHNISSNSKPHCFNNNKIKTKQKRKEKKKSIICVTNHPPSFDTLKKEDVWINKSI